MRRHDYGHLPSIPEPTHVLYIARGPVRNDTEPKRPVSLNSTEQRALLISAGPRCQYVAVLTDENGFCNGEKHQ